MTARRRRVASSAFDLRARLGVGILLALLVLLPALLLAPSSPGAVRAFGVSLAWWYGGVVAPLLAVVTTVLSLGGSGRRRHD